MSKKIISAILVMAMIVSMSATVLLSSVGAAAATDYEADRDELKSLIQKLVVYGPGLEERTEIVLEQMGIVTWNKDKGNYDEYIARADFWGKYGDPEWYLFLGEDYTDLGEHFVANFPAGAVNVDGKVEWITDLGDYETYVDLAIRNISNIVEYAASAWYFGQLPNDELVDPSFNEGRNAVVKAATKMIKAIFSALAGEVTATVKPLGYQEIYDSEWYMGFIRNGVVYNHNIGFNPYFYLIDEYDYWFDENNFWGINALGQYPVRWYTFAEARSIAPDETFAVEIAIRELAMKNGAGILFWDFLSGDYAKFNKAIDDLFKKLVGDITAYFTTDDTNFEAQIKAFLRLEAVVDIYDKYVKDVYNNIYTASAAQLLNDVLYAKRIIDFVNANGSKLMVIVLADFTALTDKIVAEIKAVAPRAEQQLSAADVTEGTNLVRKAEALLKNWSNWAEFKDGNEYKETWKFLNNAKEDLKTMLPAAAGESVIVVVPEHTAPYMIKDVTDKEVWNDRVVVEFTPNWFSYWKFSALLKAAIEAFNAKLNETTLPDVTTTTSASNTAIVDLINKYAFLAGYVGPVLKVVDGEIVMVEIYEDGVGPDCPLDNELASHTYSFYLFDNVKARDSFPTEVTKTILSLVKHRIQRANELGAQEYEVSCIYEEVVGYARGNGESWIAYDYPEYDEYLLNQDVAIDSVYNFLQTFLDVCLAVRNTSASTYAAVGFDWTIPTYPVITGDAVGEATSATAGLVKDLKDAIKLLTADITKLIQIYGWILHNVEFVLDWDITTDGGDHKDKTVIATMAGMSPLSEILPCITDPANYPKDFMKTAKAAAEKLAKLLVENEAETPATKTAVVKAYDEFVKALKAYILTDEGAAKFDAFVDDCYYIVNHYFGEPDSYNYELLIEKLSAGMNTILVAKYADAKNCYQYFQLTLEHAVKHPWAPFVMYNLYYGEDPEEWANASPLKVNFLDPIDSMIGISNVSAYTRDWADKFQEIRTIATLVRGCIAGDEETGYYVMDNDLKDMPVWYAERVLEELTAAWADRVNYTRAGLVAYKAALEALLIEADSKNVYEFKTDTDEAKAIWADFVDAYSNGQYVYLDVGCSKADVDEAVALLTAAMDKLGAIEVADGASNKDTLAAKVAAAEALYARADLTTDKAAMTELELAIAEAKKALQFTITVLNSNDIDTLIKNIDSKMNTLAKSMYTGKDLKKDVKVLELQVVVDLYTEASYRKFANAVEAAYKMAEEDTAKESAMKKAYDSVAARFADLKLAPVEEPVEDPTQEPVVEEPAGPSVIMEQAIAIYNEASKGYDKAVEGCTAETTAAYKAAIATLKADIDKEADDATLLEAIIALNLAKAALTVPVPETFDD